MSLLNDMLRDLSQHKPVADGAEGYNDELLQSSSITQKKQQAWLPLVILFIVIFVVVIGANYSFHRLYGKTNPEPAQQTVKTVEPTIKDLSINSSPEAVSTTALKETSTSENEAATAELQNHIDDLLMQADRAMAMDRLTMPVEDNAYGYYQKILGMSANNNDAKEGLDKIAARYLLKAQEQIQLGNTAQADALIQRARFVSARYVQAHEISLSEPVDQLVTETNSQPIGEVQQSNQSAQLSQTLQTTPAPQTTKETIKPFPVVEAPMVSVAPNAGWKDEQLSSHAQALIRQGKQAEALEQLKKFVATEQKPALSAALLADLYIQQGNTQAAEVITEKINYLPVDVKAKLKAQILSANGDDAQAITLLEKDLSAADNNEAYRSLLASLYHKTANYQQSIISYQRLISSFGEKPAYWLGLALAYDGLSQHKSALQAYQRLREYPQLQEQVKKYTDQRIAALRSE